MPDSDGEYPYYSTYSDTARKVFYPSKWPCCSGTLVQTVADYPLNIAFASDDGLYVVLYTPSQIRFARGAVAIQIEQDTAFPVSDNASLKVSLNTPANFTLHLRLPAWLSRPATIKINGRSIVPTGGSGSFESIRRTWHNGDRIDLTLPQDFRAEAIDDVNPNTVALMRGPVQYVAIEASNEPVNGRRLFPSSLKQIGQEVFVQDKAGCHTVFVPLRSILNETYTSYFSKA